MKIIKSLIFTLIFFIGFLGYSWAFLTPQLYIGGAVSKKKSTIDLNVPQTDSIKSSFNTSSYLLSVGVRPLDIPIIGDFRVEAQYLGALSSSNKDNQYGLVLYYDIFRFIPFINPYIGIGTQYATYKIKNKSDLMNKRNKQLYTFHAGITAKLPVLPLDFYLEYRYSNTFSSNSNPYSYKISSHDAMLGVRYYILG